MTAGPNKTLWFTGRRGDRDAGAIGTLTSDGHISIRKTATPSRGIVQGADNAVWFTSDTSIGRIGLDGRISRYSVPTVHPGGIGVGPDHALWFNEQGEATIGRITTTGRIRNYHDGRICRAAGAPRPGPDGALWFSNCNSIGRITTDGRIRIFTGRQISKAWSNPWNLTAGPDGALWFTEEAARSAG